MKQVENLHKFCRRFWRELIAFLCSCHWRQSAALENCLLARQAFFVCLFSFLECIQTKLFPGLSRLHFLSICGLRPIVQCSSPLVRISTSFAFLHLHGVVQIRFLYSIEVYKTYISQTYDDVYTEPDISVQYYIS